MTREEKLTLLSRNIWRRKEVNAYFDNIFTTCELNKILRLIKEKTAVPKETVYRDEVFRVLKTSVKKEIKMLQSLETIKEEEK